ncbi:flagellar hook protein FlgE [Duganella sp. FT27W]|uniref:flagellar hook protein FlgE n=1 Tax=Duganella sp. FT27W TaxID=2654636 RepID=UPI00128D320D|nr:flagellar hook-basal body complex protein [Duganella sp. FT27W]MPQ55511.1 flagellar hook-basal body complex protein [Duganella sp. FT27W]
MSFDIALSGIQAINEALNSTSQNIANAGTYGYKAQRANFSSLVSGELQTGVTIGSVTQNISKPGGVLSTGRSLDAAINGGGFFISKAANSDVPQYSRVGIFETSKDGYLVDTQGNRVQGYPINPLTSAMGAVGDLPIQTGAIPAVASGKMTYVGNMSADWTVPAAWPANSITPTTPPDPSTFNMSKATVIYDTLGGKHTLTQYFSRDDTLPNTVNVNYLLDGAVVPGSTATVLKFNPATGSLQSVNDVPPDATTGAIPSTATVNLSGITPLANGANLTNLVIDYDGSTGNSGEATTSANNAEGYASGTYTSLALGNDGSLIATYSNGQKQTVGKLALATFVNEGALTTISGTSWTESLESGRPLVNAPGTGTGGTITSSSLEQSNVDITSELVGLMTSQRNYQANSKVIQTESTMMQSLMQAI